MLTECDVKKHDTEERVGKAMTVLGLVTTGLTILVLFIGWLLN